METDDLRQHLDCRLIAEHYGVHFKRKQGKWWLTSCINHDAHSRGDKNPSFSVGEQGYKCFSANCGISGDVFGLIAWFEELDVRNDFSQIMEIAAELAGVAWDIPPLTMTTHASSKTTADLARYLTNHDPVFCLPTGHKRFQMMGELWAILKDAPLTASAVDWLTSRGIDAQAAYAQGCRDWMACSEDILNLLATWSDDDLCAAGLAAREEEKLKLWVGLRAVSDENWAQGLALPMFYPESPTTPLAWRWRLFEPVEFSNGGVLKALAQYSGEPALPMVPLGLVPSAFDVRAEDAPPYIVVIAEGEPDFLSIAQVGGQLNLSVTIVPLGIVAVSQSFAPDHMDLLLGAQRVICMLDRGRLIKSHGLHGGEDRAYQIATLMLCGLLDRFGNFEEAYQHLLSSFQLALQADDCDVNDRHQHGELKGLLHHLLTHEPDHSQAPLLLDQELWTKAFHVEDVSLVQQQDLAKARLDKEAKALSLKLGAVEAQLQNLNPPDTLGRLFQPLKALGWLHREAPKQRVLLSHKGDCVLPLGKVGFFVGEGGIGKSWALTQLAIAVSTGTPWLQTFQVPETSVGAVALIMAEEDQDELHRRVRNIVSHLDLAAHFLSDLEQRLWPVPLAGHFVEFLQEGQSSPNFDEFCTLLSRNAPPEGWSLIVLDPASRFMGADAEKDNALATRFVQLLEQMTKLPGHPTVLCVHHTTKTSRMAQGGASRAGALRGASALTDGARWQGNLFAAEDDQNVILEDQAVFTVTKSNYGPKPAPVYLKRKSGSGVLIPFEAHATQKSDYSAIWED